MYLSKLEIFGFKSFANKTVVNFTKGITGIVGPNGCGKTNIVDAIRWSLGEQKSSTLRSDKMENVIFNGTRTKKPMGMSEVSLTLVNDNSVLPTEYNEVTITRRIFRSGESEYLLNKNLCRLKDITNLFMDTGMGTNAYSVIELKMIETILSNKTDERRKMFEEAAGVNKYKLRRRLALKKLEEIKGDLTRVNDIVSEVEKNVRSLERQAKKADQYNQIQTVLREKEIDLAEREFSLFNSQKIENTEQRDILNLEKDNIDLEIKTIEVELVKYRDRIIEVERKLREIQHKTSIETEKMHAIQNAISISQERIKSQERNLSRYSTEIEEFEIQLENTEFSIEDNIEQLVDLEKSITNRQEEIEELKNIVAEKKVSVETKRQFIKSESGKLISIEKNLSSEENKLSNLKSSLNRANNNIAKLNDNIQNVTTKIAKTVGFLEELDVAKQKATKRLHETEELYAEKTALKEGLEKQLSGLKENEIDYKSTLNALKDKISFISTLITNLDGVSKGVKVLIESKGWTEKDISLFADVGNTDEKYRPALESSLKFVLNNLLIENLDELNNAIDYLKKNELGKASFYLLNSNTTKKKTLFDRLDNIRSSKRKNRIEKEDGFLGWAINFVQAENQWLPYFTKVLKNTAMVDSLSAAIKLNQKYPGYNFTTIEGDIIYSNGIVEAGSLLNLDDSLFGRKLLLENLKNEYPVLNNKLELIREEIILVEAEIADIDLKVISEQGKFLENDITTLEKQIAQFEFEKTKAEEEVEKSHSQINEFVKESDGLDRQISELENTLISLRQEKTNIKSTAVELEHELKSLEENYTQTVTSYNQKMLELERTKGKIQNLKNDINRGQETKKNIITGIERRKKDINSAQEEISSNKNIVEEKEIDLEQVSYDRQILVNEEKKVEKDLNVIKQESATFETNLNKLRNNRQKTSDSIHAIDVKMSEISIRLENLINHIMEEYNVELIAKIFDDFEIFNFQERSSEVSSLKGRLKNIGPVNLLAYSEYEEERERMEFLVKQRDDLVNSEKDLIKTIKDINETAQKLFVETFEQIRINFKKIFQTLFDPGDEADLTLEENVDPLEGKIEIMAKPKGKRPTSIELLSGGEKTLTATALLFAIYLVKPSPFCILDEVDAPLDDANVDRFTRLLKEFSNNTQFIIVTHNKRTMEASENMYGVTMQEEGISKLVGVQFNEEINVAS
ncbi:MAG: chromosome segregation protein SMC [bacterium]